MVTSLFIVTRPERSISQLFRKREYPHIWQTTEYCQELKRSQRFIVYDECPRFREEIYKYVWKKNTGEPLKENDDVLCAIRYGIYSDMTVREIETPQKQIQNAKRLRGMLR